MRAVWISGLSSLLATWLLFTLPTNVHAEPQRQQAAAEAYDRGSAAYSAGDYAEAASWFETAYRHAPAAEALIVAARSHARAGNLMRAATLALVLREMYPSHTDAAAAAEELLTAYQGKFLRVKVVCDQCALEVDGRLQAEYEFFVEPDQQHNVTASNGADEQTKPISGAAGKDVLVMFSLAAPSSEPVVAPTPDTEAEPTPVVKVETPVDGKPLPPLAIYIAAGVTGALLAGSVAITVHTMKGVSKYEDAAQRFQSCTNNCEDVLAGAKSLADKGHRNEMLTNVGWISTAVVGVVTAAAALWWTDWDGDDASSSTKSLQFAVTPGLDLRSGAIGVRGEF